MVTGFQGGLRLAELIATVSLATDLAHDVPAESALRDALLAVELGRRAGWSDADLSDVYYLALLYHVGCTGAVGVQSRMGGGDDISVRHWFSEADFSSRVQMLRLSMTKLAPGWGLRDWVHSAADFTHLQRLAAEAFADQAEVAARLADRLGAGAPVCNALQHAYVRWDGKVFLGLPSGEALTPMSRLVHLVHVARTHHQFGGINAADAVVRSRSGTEFDPGLATLWLENGHDLFRALEAPSVWDQALGAEPPPWRRVAPAHLDEIGAALADFVDLKSPYTHGHSTRMAQLAVDAGTHAGLSGADLATLRRAAQTHDLGNLSVPDQIWIKPGKLNPSEWSRVRLHTYHSQRILTSSSSLRPVGDIAGLHHEHIDGSGYHRGLPAAAIPLISRVLAAAETYASMTEERAWRPALTREAAEAELRREAIDGRLDRRAVDAVLAAAGHRSTSKRTGGSWPAGLTDREVDVLRLLARGHTNKRIASRLHISEATVHTHLINIYGKASVRTRAGATLFAMEHDLVHAAPDEKID